MADKTSEVISFRLSQPEVQALKNVRKSRESPSQTAQRLLRKALGVSNPEPVNAVSTNLSTEEINKLKYLANLPVPTRNEFHDLKVQVNSYKLSLQREIQDRDKVINLLAQQIAELTARLDESSGNEKEVTQVKTPSPKSKTTKKNSTQPAARDNKKPKTSWEEWEDVCGDNEEF